MKNIQVLKIYNISKKTIFGEEYVNIVVQIENQKVPVQVIFKRLIRGYNNVVVQDVNNVKYEFSYQDIIAELCNFICDWGCDMINSFVNINEKPKTYNEIIKESNINPLLKNTLLIKSF